MDADRYRLILDNAFEGFWDWDLAADRAYLSPRYCELVGYSPDDTIFDSCFFASIIHPDDRAHVFKTIEEHLCGLREISVIEYRMISRDGTVRWVEGRGRIAGYDSTGVPCRVVGTIIDISDRKRAEKELLESEKRYRTVLQTAMDGFFIGDIRGRILQVNETYCRMSGYSEQELLSMRVTDIEALETPDETAAHTKRLQEQGSDRFESRHSRKDGSQYDVEVSIQHRPDEDGRCLVFIRDISEGKQAKAELQRKNTEIEQFIYTVSHDLRSPLVTVKTFMGFLEKDLAGDQQEHIAKDIQFIHGAADKMKLLLDELLELSRIGRIETLPEHVPLRELLAGVLDVLAGTINERSAEIALPDMDLMLFGDRSHLCQVWQNLIENAIKYSPVEIPPRIELGVNQAGGETVFFVKDSGIGIDPRFSGKIFGIFEKLDAKSPGAGMGLALVQRIVENTGGKIWVESEGIGKGSCFYFTLPMALVQ